MSDIAVFFQAVQSGDRSKVGALLDANLSLANARSEKGQSAVLVAVYTGRKEIRDLMLARGIALELDEAAAAGQLARVKQFVRIRRWPTISRPTDFRSSDWARHLGIARWLNICSPKARM